MLRPASLLPPFTFDARRRHFVGQSLVPGLLLNVTADRAPAETPMFWLTPDFTDRNSGLIDGAPLEPLENPYELRDPIRYRWQLARPMTRGLLDTTPLPPGMRLTKAEAILRVLDQHENWTSARLRNTQLCGQQEYVCVEKLDFYSRLACGCSIHQLMESNRCCDYAILQRRPKLPDNEYSGYFHPIDYSLQDPVRAAVSYAGDLALSEEVQRRHNYHVTCVHEHGHERLSRERSLRMLVFKMLYHPVDHISRIFVEYLGKNILAPLFAPLFSRTCPLHNSFLDHMDRHGPFGYAITRADWKYPHRPQYFCSVNDQRKSKMLRWSYFNYVLSPVLLTKKAHVRSVTTVLAKLEVRVMTAVASLSSWPHVGNGHVYRHHNSRKAWCFLYKLFFDPYAAVEEVLIGRPGEEPEDADAPWFPILMRTLCDAVLGSVSGEYATITHAPSAHAHHYSYATSMVDAYPVTCWREISLPGNLCVRGTYIDLGELYPPCVPRDTCQASCKSFGFEPWMELWARRVSKPLPELKKWMNTPKRRHSPRRFGESDSDDTEDN